MKSPQSRSDFDITQEIWLKAEQLVSPQVLVREQALDFLMENDIIRKSPLIASLVVSRLTDPDVEFRFHIVQALGAILGGDNPESSPSSQVLSYIHASLGHFSKDQIIELLEVGDRYISAEESLLHIFQICSYAGNILNGIVNDRKVPLGIRKQAIFICGEVGFLDSAVAIKGLIARQQKRKDKQKNRSLRISAKDEKELYPYAVRAMEKLDPGTYT